MSIKITNLCKSFDGKEIFNGFTYEFAKTGIYAITGPSGVGKTTLLRMIAGLDKKYSGKIVFEGECDISFAFQEYRLFNQLSAIDNILQLSFKEPTQDDIENTKNLLRRLKFSDSDMNLTPSQLSGGMKQRISFARAIMKKSSVLLLDEATKELDQELSDILIEMIRQESKEKLVILVTHKPEEITKLGATTISI